MNVARWVLIGLLSVVLLACSSAAPSSSVAPTQSAGSGAITAGSPASSGSTCDADLTFTGGIEGRIKGAQSGHAKYQGPNSTNIKMSLYFDVAGPKPALSVDLQLFTVNGLWVTLGRVDTGDVGLWHVGQGGNATLAADGSSASMDMAVTAVNMVPVHIAGTITCPAAPPTGP
jgi:hypothetical protein